MEVSLRIHRHEERLFVAEGKRAGESGSLFFNREKSKRLLRNEKEVEGRGPEAILQSSGRVLRDLRA